MLPASELRLRGDCGLGEDLDGALDAPLGREGMRRIMNQDARQDGWSWWRRRHLDRTYTVLDPDGTLHWNQCHRVARSRRGLVAALTGGGPTNVQTMPCGLETQLAEGNA